MYFDQHPTPHQQEQVPVDWRWCLNAKLAGADLAEAAGTFFVAGAAGGLANGT